jgi:hypothetical protein
MWNCVTSTNPKLFQSPFRAGIKLDSYQLEPLRNALRLPRVNLFIADDVRERLMPFVKQYRRWIESQRAAAPTAPERRKVIANELLRVPNNIDKEATYPVGVPYRNQVLIGVLNKADMAAKRIEQGIELLSDPLVLDAFRIANRAMQAQAVRRLEIPDPEWRPFQLAFLLMKPKGCFWIARLSPRSAPARCSICLTIRCWSAGTPSIKVNMFSAP